MSTESQIYHRKATTIIIQYQIMSVQNFLKRLKKIEIATFKGKCFSNRFLNLNQNKCLTLTVHAVEHGRNGCVWAAYGRGKVNKHHLYGPLLYFFSGDGEWRDGERAHPQHS